MVRTEQFTLKPTTAGDLIALQEILEETGLFPSEMLPVVLRPFLEGETAALWISASDGDRAVGFCFAEREAMTAGTWNLRALAVMPSLQGEGIGRLLISGLEARLKQRGERILIIDTSSTDAFADARAIYSHLGFREEARIRDFWSEGDDKITHWKRLTTPQ